MILKFYEWATQSGLNYFDVFNITFCPVPLKKYSNKKFQPSRSVKFLLTNLMSSLSADEETLEKVNFNSIDEMRNFSHNITLMLNNILLFMICL